MLRHDAVIKERFHRGLNALARAPRDTGLSLLRDLLADEVRWSGCHPIGNLSGRDAPEHRVWRPLRRAFADLERRDDIFIGGTPGGQDWVAASHPA